MEMTPRRLAGVLNFSQIKRKHDMADEINVAAVGSRGDRKALKKVLGDLTKE